MKITKAQSKQLRYICGAVAYNQPCTRKYTGGPKGKIREIGKFKYIEKEGELLYFEYDGEVAALSRYSADEFLSALADDTHFSLGGGVKVEDLRKEEESFNNEETLTHDLPFEDVLEKCAADLKKEFDKETNTLEITVIQNEVHKVNIPIQVQPVSDGWMDDEGNDPDNLDEGTADIAELLTGEEKKAADEPPQPMDTSANIPPVESVRQNVPETVVKPTPVTEDRWGAGLRETAMTAAAREAAMDCGIDGIPDDATSVDIVRACHTTPGFMECYGECLKKVGNPRSLEEIADALPAQRKWLFK